MQVIYNQSDQTKYARNTSYIFALQDEDASFKVAKFIIYIIILTVSTTGNSLLIGVIYRSPRMRTKPGNLLILNLALCDFALPIISIPFDLVIQETAYQWPFGQVMCKLLGPLATLAVTSSSLTLAGIALDRHRALLHPFKRRLSLCHVKYMIVSLHVFSLIVVLPYAIHLDISDDRICTEYWPVFEYRQAYTIVLALSQYFIPLFFMLWMYILSASKLYRSSSKLKRILSNKEENNFAPSVKRSFRIRQGKNLKVTKMFSIIVFIFVIFTLPNQIFWIWSDFAEGYKYKEAVYVAIVCHWFTYANSCLNPLVFFAYSRDFNNGLRQIVRRLLCKDSSGDVERLHSIWRETMMLANTQTGISSKTVNNKVLEKLEMAERQEFPKK